MYSIRVKHPKSIPQPERLTSCKIDFYEKLYISIYKKILFGNEVLLLVTMSMLQVTLYLDIILRLDYKYVWKIINERFMR